MDQPPRLFSTGLSLLNSAGPFQPAETNGITSRSTNDFKCRSPASFLALCAFPFRPPRRRPGTPPFVFSLFGRQFGPDTEGGRGGEESSCSTVATGTLPPPPPPPPCFSSSAVASRILVKVRRRGGDRFFFFFFFFRRFAFNCTKKRTQEEGFNFGFYNFQGEFNFYTLLLAPFPFWEL